MKLKVIAFFIRRIEGFANNNNNKLTYLYIVYCEVFYIYSHLIFSEALCRYYGHFIHKTEVYSLVELLHS